MWLTVFILCLFGLVFSAVTLEEPYYKKYKYWTSNGYADAAGVFIAPPLNASVLDKGQSIEFEVCVPYSGLYNIQLVYTVLSDELAENEAQVKINGEYQYYESRRVILPQYWKSQSTGFAVDRYGNQLVPLQIKYKGRIVYTLRDSAFYKPEPLRFFLQEGINNINLAIESGKILLEGLALKSYTPLLPYESYISKYGYLKNENNFFLSIEAESIDYKNDTSVNPFTSRDIQVVPYDTNRLMLNTMGEKSWSKSGQEVFYTFSVPSDGFYSFGFKYLQAGKANSSVYRRMRIDGEILCTVCDAIKFDYTTSWNTLKMAYPLYLSQGEHTLSLEVNGGVYSEYIDILYETIEEVNSLALEIKKLTGGNTASKNTEWDILNYFPKIQQQLGGYIEKLEHIYNKVLQLNNQKGSSQELISLAGAIRSLSFLRKEPDLIPRRFSLLNEGTSSVVKELSKALTEFENQPLQLDQIYIYTDEKALPDYRVSFLKRISEGFKRFFFSFLPKNKSFSKDGTVLRVWVNRSRNYVELLQKITDSDFTAKTGIKVDFSIMPDEQKLILSNASGTSPDIALTISNWLPFELGIRGAALDLRQFSDFGEVICEFAPGALLPYVYEKGCFGLPETQDFYVLFYRKDIMEKLNLPIPATWDEVMLILPELQRYGMNFYLPIAGASGFKPVTVTTPFIYQYHGELYSEDGFRTALDEPNSLKAIELMTKLFTLYGLELQVPNFFEHFRSGLSPIGISNFTTYVQLNVGAPELKNSWDIALAPGIKNENGVVERWHAGSAQACMIFKNTKNPESSWEFIKWWMSQETQSSFGYQVQALYGKEYMYNSANLRAFGQIPIPSEHKTIALQQWEWMKEIPKTPAGYMLERELSNIWIKIVLQGKNTRAAVDESVIRINKEISRKLEEFGYSVDGVKIKDYYIPTIEDIAGWRNDYEEKQ